MSLHRVLSSVPPDNSLPSDPGSARDRPRAGRKVRHCQAGRHRQACLGVRAMVSVEKKGNVSHGVCRGKAGTIAIQCAMIQNTIKKVSRREQSTEACSAGARHARGGAVRGAQGGVGGVVAALSSWRLCTRSVRTSERESTGESGRVHRGSKPRSAQEGTSWRVVVPRPALS